MVDSADSVSTGTATGSAAAIKRKASQLFSIGPEAKRSKKDDVGVPAAAKRLLDALDSFEELIQSSDIPVMFGVQAFVIRQAIGFLLDGIYDEGVLELLNTPFTVPNGAEQTPRKELEGAIRALNRHLTLLVEKYKQQLQLATAIPPPDRYAMLFVWPEWQEKDTAILCLRPVAKQGLPLCVLHNVFREFQREAQASLPVTEDARKAMKAAFDLCRTMADPFPDEKARGAAFDLCVDPLLPRDQWREQVHLSADPENRGGRTDKSYEVFGEVRIIREDKPDTGTGDDFYMQICRDFQLYVKMKTEAGMLKHGFPMFLLCLAGPLLWISGGFYDSQSTILEPLVAPCLMFNDHLSVCQDVLARRLFALKNAIYSNLWSEGALGDPRPGVPRVYPSYTTESDTTEHKLQFQRPVPDTLPQSLLSLTSDDSPAPKLVKLVMGNYGLEVHELLASRGLAPMFYGKRSLTFAPTAYVMEYLAPSTDTSTGWMTLAKFAKPTIPEIHRPHIRTALEHILQAMEDANVVHGDFRPNNIMIAVDDKGSPMYIQDEHGSGRVTLKVIDFDWAEKSGTARYPLQRNENIQWPEKAGQPIIKGDDRKLVDWWWQKYVESSSFSLIFVCHLGIIDHELPSEGGCKVDS